MFSSILNTSSNCLTVENFLICTLAALILGLAISISYIAAGIHSKNMAVSLVILPMLIQIVILLVNGNMGAGLAVLGAFSLVRFRSQPGSSRDICFIFFAMVVGLATGMGYVIYAAVLTVVVSIIILILSKTAFGDRRSADRFLKITIPENLDYTNIFDDIFDQYTKKANLNRVKTTNLGSMFELHYNIKLKEAAEEKNMLDAIRCRNGNLNIVCSRQQPQSDEF
jgi:uncharacterized membrane protein YhiD involved in acid resistance